MASGQVSVTRQREIALREVCASLAADLRKIDPPSYFLFFEFGEFPEIFDEVTRCMDRHFRKGRLGFACTGEAKIAWASRPTVSVDMEFSCEDILAFFRLNLFPDNHDVELHHISFQQSAGDPEKNTHALTSALERSTC